MHVQGTLIFMLSTFIGLMGLAGCGGGEGEGSEQATAPVPTNSALGISGRLIVPRSNVVEIEPNNTLRQVQAITSASTVSGNAAASDPGFVLSDAGGVKVEDVYDLEATEPVRISLTLATDDPHVNDLDLLLMDHTGHIIDLSDGTLATETLETPGAGNFLVGVRASRGASAYVLSIASLESFSAPQAETPPDASFVLGEVLVKLTAGSPGSPHGLARLQDAYGLHHVRSELSGGTVLRVTPQREGNGMAQPLSLRTRGALEAQTFATIRALRADPDVVYAEPNFLRQPALVPHDAYFGRQWSSQLLHLPLAWHITTGSERIIVAVIDTGVLLDHPDLQGRLMPGYDFISDTTRANDGDGIDADPYDSGNDPQGIRSSFHGTHVAGTIGAVTNNDLGVAGVTWQTRIMPLRVSGVGGAADADTAQAIRYAAGLPNSSGTVPSARAHIINLSLAGPEFGRTLRDAIHAALAQGVMVVAAAGNQNTRTPFYPASYEGVLAVSAVDIAAHKAPYANFGTTIDVAAPGGNLRVDLDGDGFVDGVLNTAGDDAGNFSYEFFAGTSMASAHVAGVFALMLAVNPHLTATDIGQLLAGTHPETTIQITSDLGAVGRDDLFGYGLIDASAAVLAATFLSGNPDSTVLGNVGMTFVLVLDADTLDTVAQEQTDSSQHYAFTMPDIPPGTYRVVAGTDRDDDGFICETGDACGSYSEPVIVTAGHSTTNVHLVVDSAPWAQRTMPAFNDARHLVLQRLY